MQVVLQGQERGLVKTMQGQSHPEVARIRKKTPLLYFQKIKGGVICAPRAKHGIAPNAYLEAMQLIDFCCVLPKGFISLGHCLCPLPKKKIPGLRLTKVRVRHFLSTAIVKLHETWILRSLNLIPLDASGRLFFISQASDGLQEWFCALLNRNHHN